MLLLAVVSVDIFTKYFERYGEVIDSVVMKDRQTGRPRGFGFITYADPSVVDEVIQESHVIDGKQVSFLYAFYIISPCICFIAKEQPFQFLMS